MKRKRNDFINQPVYPGGLKALREFVRQNLVYPKAALEAKIQGKVFVKYVVNESGRVIETKVIHGLGYGCDEEAQRLVKLFRFDVKKTRGLKLKHNKSIKIHFSLAQAPKQVKKISYTVVKTAAKESPKESDIGGNIEYEIRY